ncbi:MAG: rRNA maturation RNase YbeY, partial [Flavobacteriaceae bacterium]|nr:rRNA maturation RNase YbeY [Flavobacteriaceae bacterium]
DVFISIDRVKENAKSFVVLFDDELNRVLIHGILHYMGFKDKTEADKASMRQKENECLLFLRS